MTTLSDNDEYANKLVDVSAPGASVQFHAAGDNWAIRNIGIRGADTGDRSATDPAPLITASVPAGGDAVIENVWAASQPDLQDGVAYTGGIRVADDHAGHLTIRQCNIQHRARYGIDTAPPADPTGAHGGGTVTIERCLLTDNAVANLRTGAETTVRDSCIRSNPDGVPPTPGDAPTRTRAVWQRFEPATLEDCHVSHAGADYAVVAGDRGGGVTLRGGQRAGAVEGASAVTAEDVGREPKVFTPGGCPTGPRHAAARTTPEEDG